MADTIAEVEGAKIVKVRDLTEDEKEAEGWGGRRTVVALVLDNGCVIYPSRDMEGNGPGELFGTEKDGQQFFVSVPR